MKKKSRYQKTDYSSAKLLRRLEQEGLKRKRGILRIFLITVIVVAGINLCVGPFGTIEMVRMYQNKCLLEDKVRKLCVELSDLEWELRRIDSPDYLEKVAREKYYMKKPDEVIVKLPPNILQQNDPS